MGKSVGTKPKGSDTLRTPMNRAMRAKQFMPFAALSGYEEELLKKEKIKVPKAVLSEESMEWLDQMLRELQVRNIITVTYYKKGEYLQLTGMVSGVDRVNRQLKIVNKIIPFSDLYAIERN